MTTPQSTTSNAIVKTVWSFCDTLRDDGVSYGDYLEQITYLLFLKMADEYSSAKESKNYNSELKIENIISCLIK